MELRRLSQHHVGARDGHDSECKLRILSSPSPYSQSASRRLEMRPSATTQPNVGTSVSAKFRVRGMFKPPSESVPLSRSKTWPMTMSSDGLCTLAQRDATPLCSVTSFGRVHTPLDYKGLLPTSKNSCDWRTFDRGNRCTLRRCSMITIRRPEASR